MNDTTTHAHPPHTAPVWELPALPVRTSPLDRAAMRLAIALLIWSTRAPADRDAALRRFLCERELRLRERDDRRRRLLLPLL